MRTLVQAVDQRELAGELEAQRLLPLGGARLDQVAGDLLEDGFRSSWQDAVRRGRSHALALETLTLRAVELLERQGIPTMPLKGTSLAGALYGDPAARVSEDVDLLVAAANLPQAIEVIRRLGYGLASAPPHPLHQAMVHPDPWMARIDLHWRIHWYESRFSHELLERAVRDEDGLLRPRADDELAMLLLFFARDGFVGLRLAADIAACWDRRAGELEDGAIRDLAARYPELRPALVASALAAARLVGIPASRLGIDAEDAGRRECRAVRLTNWLLRGNFQQVRANTKLVDWMLTPPAGRAESVRRNLLPRLGERAGEDAIGPFEQILNSSKLLVRYALALWQIRGGRCWSPLPAGPNQRP